MLLDIFAVSRRQPQSGLMKMVAIKRLGFNGSAWGMLPACLPAPRQRVGYASSLPTSTSAARGVCFQLAYQHLGSAWGMLPTCLPAPRQRVGYASSLPTSTSAARGVCFQLAFQHLGNAWGMLPACLPAPRQRVGYASSLPSSTSAACCTPNSSQAFPSAKAPRQRLEVWRHHLPKSHKVVFPADRSKSRHD